jgi:shikimate kinase / 3-dehydroquinate synthase
MQRPLLLNGFMGVGKSTVGRLVAQAASRPFIDLDERLEARLGTTIADYFARQGEPAFRVAEREELEKLLATESKTAPVIALGGGALLSRTLRLRALDTTVVVTLEADPQEIARRTTSQGGRPLLDTPHARARVEELLELRALAYAEAHARIPTGGRSAEAIAQDVLAIWKRDPLAVAAGPNSYSVEVGRGIAAGRAPLLVGRASSVMIVTDQNVAPLHGPALKQSLASANPACSEFVLPPGEQHKHVGSIRDIWQALQDSGADRSAVCVGLGGGVVTDMTGYTAATWLRGVRWVGIPTTLLAMVDASTGGKTGVDFGPAKNAIGAFWQPCGVICDIDLEATEPERNFSSGLSEVVKTALIGDPGMVDLMERESARIVARDPALIEELVRRSVRVKARIVSQDEREGGLRAVLNLGHTVGHALEAIGGYDRLTHGEAISLGLVAALRLGVRRGVTPAALEERVTRLLTLLGLPTDLSREPLLDAAELLAHDKKKAGKKLRFVFAHESGRVATEDLELAELHAAVRALAS